jgi:DNA-binding protein H-NS
MKKTDLENMSIDALWALHEQVSNILSLRIASEKRELEKRLAYLNRGPAAIVQDPLQTDSGEGRGRRKYPRVLAKYRNSTAPHETWSGRGKQPRWLVAAIKAGRRVEDFRIDQAAAPKGRR